MAAPLLLLLLSVVLFADVSSATIGPATFIAGGATSIVNVVNNLDPSSCASSTPYQVPGSTGGILGFNNGSYVVGTSDQPMTVLQETQPGSVSAQYGRCTIPTMIAIFGFFVYTASGAPGAVKLSPTTSYAIYKNGGDWAKYSSALKGPITRIGRNQGSGTTFLIKRYWAQGGTTFLTDYPKDLNGNPMPFSGLVLVPGSKEMCQTTATTKGAIGYAQVGICIALGSKTLTEAALQNAVGKYVVPSLGKYVQAIPTSLPKNCGTTWSNVAEKMILRSGLQTVPIVSFEYAFIRNYQLSKAGPLGIQGKNLLLCWLNHMSAVAVANGFKPLRSTVLKASIQAVNSVN